jgi:hypothetical protein
MLHYALRGNASDIISGEMSIVNKGLEQSREDAGIFFVSRIKEAGRLRNGSVFEQRADCVGMALPRGEEQGGIGKVVAGVHVGGTVEQRA